MPIGLSRMIQAGCPTMTFGSMPRAGRARSTWEEEVGNSLIVREPAGVVGRDHAVELPAAPDRQQGGAGAGRGLHGRAQAERGGAAQRLRAGRDLRGGRPARRASSTSSPGTGPVVGEAIVAHPETDMVSLHRLHARRAARVASWRPQTVKPVALELGGKSPNVILDDADLEQAVADGVAKCFLNSGQTCSALTRMLVPRDKLERGRADRRGGRPTRLHARRPVRRRHARSGRSCPTTQRERVRGYIEKGQAEGARLVTGGAEPPEGLDSGYFVRPTVFSEVTPEMTIAQEEIFGPVLSIMPYDDEEDAVRIANDTIYGLAGGVWSADEERAKRVAARIRTGQVEINGGAFNPLAPFGGYKQSGHGRELGRYGLEEFLVAKSLQL